jgi:predicted nucleotide-binding protein (sugar kinase/HSP70/actin superfamily)
VSSKNDDLERLGLLDVVSQKGIKALSKIELERLQYLIEQKDYSHDTKAQKSKTKLLKQIAIAIYDYDVKYGNSFKTSL